MSPAQFAPVVQAIEADTFPDSQDVLSYEIAGADTTELLKELQKSKDALSAQVRQTSKDEATNVDGWIAQAKKVQQDIAQCKQDARQIVTEWERVEEIQAAMNDARNKAQLLQEEIAFNQALEQQLQAVAEINLSINQIDRSISQNHYFAAATSLAALKTASAEVLADRSRGLLSASTRTLSEQLSARIQIKLDESITTDVSSSTVLVDISTNSEPEAQQNSFDDIFSSLEVLGELNENCKRVLTRLQKAVLPPFHRSSRAKLSSATVTDTRLSLDLTSSQPSASRVMTVAGQVASYLHATLPQSLHEPITSPIMSKVIDLLITDWLDHAVPIELSQFGDLDSLKHDVSNLKTQLDHHGVEDAHKLEMWVRQLSRTWLMRRQTSSLDRVRKIFQSATGSTRQVERVEKQIISVAEVPETASKEDDWDASWDDNEADTPAASTHTPATDEDDTDTDAWGFDEEDEKPGATAAQAVSKDDDETDAWGWGDDEQKDPTPQPEKSPVMKPKPNGSTAETQAIEQELTLAENYTITDIPDHILDIISKDLFDASDLESSPVPTLNPSTTATNLRAIPTLALALYRAIAPTAYTLPPFNLSAMHLYNDALYLHSTLSTSHATTLSTSLPTLTRFARTTYTKEMDQQRTILLDLLDNAQGFVSCTKPPYAEACDTAIASTTEYIRSLHTQWSPILSPSHLHQAIGSLLSAAIHKIIKDIEDMEDISEPESQRLVKLCEQVTALADLFPSPSTHSSPTQTPAPDAAAEETSTSAIHIYTPPYFRFQYLIQILDSSLVDIRYLWTDGGLSADFEKEEVVDLIKALFAESTHRRSAISAIRGT